MAFFKSIKEGWTLFKDSISFLFKRPVFLVPIFICRIITASIVLFLRYYDFPSMRWVLLYIYISIFIITFTICFANIIMLEFMQQMESGKKISFLKALKEAFTFDLIKIIPISAIWAFIWFIILIIEALARGEDRKEQKKPDPSFRDAARTLSGMESGPFSWLKLGLEMFKKLLRMTVFLILPAIAWENKGPFSAFKKSLEIIKKHPVQFLTSYTITGIAALFMALPLIPIYILDELHFTFPAIVWTIVIIYVGVIWTLNIYLEQMSVGLLYLWHLNWEKKGSNGDLSSVKKPDLFDNVYELKK